MRADVLRFYFGSYLDGDDPFEAGLLDDDNGTFYVHPAALEKVAPGDAPALDANADGRVSKGELTAFVEATYATARALPATVQLFRESTGYGGADWFTVELHGVMTTARRRTAVPDSALRAALAGYDASGQQLLYPRGTTFVGEHVDENGQLLETTAMHKRADGLWDFFVYGPDGALATQTNTPPRALRAPVQCVGCHFGNRGFEPEASFPAAAPDGPHGPRALYVPDAWRDADLVAFFNEHRKRSDHVLGLYNTLYVARARARGDTLPPIAKLPQRGAE